MLNKLQKGLAVFLVVMLVSLSSIVIYNNFVKKNLSYEDKVNKIINRNFNDNEIKENNKLITWNKERIDNSWNNRRWKIVRNERISFLELNGWRSLQDKEKLKNRFSAVYTKELKTVVYDSQMDKKYAVGEKKNSFDIKSKYYPSFYAIYVMDSSNPYISNKTNSYEKIKKVTKKFADIEMNFYEPKHKITFLNEQKVTNFDGRKGYIVEYSVDLTRRVTIAYPYRENKIVFFLGKTTLRPKDDFTTKIFKKIGTNIEILD